VFAACRFKEFNAAFKECVGQFDVVINCVSAKVDFGRMMGMLAHDGVAVQVS
jgi:D-arabinose 1-dehydrogenase-like Zn-dependent alcohol dehydrogenase